MGLCNSKSVANAKVIRNIKRGDEGMAFLMEHLPNILPEKKDRLGMSPFLVACKFGHIKIAEAFLKGPHSMNLNPRDFSEGLWHACSGNHTKTDLCAMLLTPTLWNGRCADPNYADRHSLNTPLHLLLRKRKALTGIETAERCHAIALLCKAGAKFEAYGADQKTPLEMGISSKFERGSVALVTGGAPLIQVQKYIKDHPHDNDNWVANSLLSKFSFKHPVFLKQMKEQFMQEFDPDGSGELDRKELLHFIAFHVKIGMQHGMCPVKELADRSGDTDIATIKALLQERCPALIQKYESLDTGKNGDTIVGSVGLGYCLFDLMRRAM